MLLQTKFHIPTARTALVARPHLLKKLQTGQIGKVTLVTAPAGFGKTTLVTEWLRTLDPEVTVAWLSLDKADNDPTQFWAYIVRAIDRTLGQVNRSIQPVPRASDRAVPNAVTIALLNELSARHHPVVLALDDYHLIDNAAIHEALLFLIEQMPPQLHLVLTTRTVPSLPLARLRSRHEINELRAEDLRFSLAEVTLFLNQIMGLSLTTSQVAALEARTEGWVASLQLAALSLQSVRDPDQFIAAFGGGHRYILDYLTEEALQHQPPTVRDFLLKSSILERISAPLCNLLTGRDDGQTILTRLEQANLFLIPLDEQRQWYRYHHLFADLLRQLLQAEVGDAGLAQLHRQVARWFAEQEQIEDAIHHALAGRDYALAVELIVAVELATENKGKLYTLFIWYKALPTAILQANPKLTIRYAHKVMMVDDADNTDALLNSPWLANLSDPELLGEIAVLRGYTACERREFDRTAQYVKEAKALLPPTNDFYGGIYTLQGFVELERGNLEAATAALQHAATWNQAAGRIAGAINNYSTLAAIYQQQAKPEEADQALRACLKLVEGTAGATEGNVYMELAWLHLHRSELHLCTNFLYKGLAIYEQIGDVWGARRALLFLAMREQLQRRYSVANELLHKAQQYVPLVKDLWGNLKLETLEVELAWCQGDPEPMQRWLHTAPTWPTEFAFEYKLTCCHFQILLATEASNPTLPAQLFTDLAALLAEAEQKHDFFLQTFLLALMALAEATMGQREQAYVHLQQAFDLAAPTAYLLPFWENGPPMEALVRDACAAGVGGEFAQKVLQSFQQFTHSTDQSISISPKPEHALFASQPMTTTPTITPPRDYAANTALIEQLTAREQEVLALIVAGLTNQEIAEQLVISIATVKRHISNLYGKLEVEHRTQAIARARELQLR